MGFKASEERTQLIRFRREMQEAIAEEDYERAGKLRDMIQRIEQGDDKNEITE